MGAARNAGQKKTTIVRAKPIKQRWNIEWGQQAPKGSEVASSKARKASEAGLSDTRWFFSHCGVMLSAVDGLRAIGGGAMVESFARFTHPTCPALSSIKNAPAFIRQGRFS
jgi:hypothetical protein